MRRYKHVLLPRGVAPRTVLSGFMRGVRMERDFDGEAQHVLGLYERELTPWLHRLSREVNTGIDVGSADGMFPLYFLLKTPARRVLGFEPTERREKLFRNMAADGLSGDPRFTLLPLFVGARTGEGMTTLDSHLSEVTTPYLVKIDVEGAEADVLRGATQLLKMAGVLSSRRTRLSWSGSASGSSRKPGTKPRWCRTRSGGAGFPTAARCRTTSGLCVP